MTLRSAAVAVLSYLFGGAPVAYLTGRALRGVDIRDLGSGNAGASNVWQTVSRAAVVPVGLTEIAQGALPVLATRAAGGSSGLQAIAGVASLAGHCWSPFLGLTGGRGIGHAIGIMGALSRPALAAFAALSLAGVALRAIPQGVGLGVLAAPVVALARQAPTGGVAGLAAVAALVFAKRALANDGLPRDPEVLRNRLLYDRDTRERASWVRRHLPS